MRTMYPFIETTIIGMILMALLIVVSVGFVVLYLQPKGRLSCASFGAYSDIPSNWKQTMPWLDGNQNGSPCDTLYKKKI